MNRSWLHTALFALCLLLPLAAMAQAPGVGAPAAQNEQEEPGDPFRRETPLSSMNAFVEAAEEVAQEGVPNGR